MVSLSFLISPGRSPVVVGVFGSEQGSPTLPVIQPPDEIVPFCYRCCLSVLEGTKDSFICIFFVPSFISNLKTQNR